MGGEGVTEEMQPARLGTPGTVFRALEHVLISPGMHHTHHGYGRDGATYRNYAVTFAFYDWMFGTLHIPEGRPGRYGLPGAQPHWAEEVFYPLFRRAAPTKGNAARS